MALENLYFQLYYKSFEFIYSNFLFHLNDQNLISNPHIKY
jgi:hypothetical protein